MKLMVAFVAIILIGISATASIFVFGQRGEAGLRTDSVDAQTGRADLRVPDEMASRCLESIKELYSLDRDPANFNMKMLRPVSEVIVPVNKIADTKIASDELLSLFRRKTTDFAIYPAKAGNQVKASASLIRKNDEWSVASFSKHPGNHLTEVLEQISELAKKDGKDEDNYYLVKIRGLNLEFIGLEKNEATVLLTPTGSWSEYEPPILKGDTSTAIQVLAKIREPARAYISKQPKRAREN